MNEHKESFEKLKALAHYIISLCDANPLTLGAIRLNKILWFSDTQAYGLFEKSITGAVYTKRQFGPVPKGIVPAIQFLSDEGKISTRDISPDEGGGIRGFSPCMIREYKSLKDPSPSNFFSKEELSLTKSVQEIVCGFSAMEISEISHDSVWRAAKMGEEIPMEATLASRMSDASPEDSRFWNLLSGEASNASI